MKGSGSKFDKDEAIRWYKLSAEAGYPPGQYILGTLKLFVHLGFGYINFKVSPISKAMALRKTLTKP